MSKQMKKIIFWGMAAVMVLCAVACGKTAESREKNNMGQTGMEPNRVAAQKEGFPFTLITQDDMQVTFDRVPERVLCTNPNAGEQLMALGLEDKIVATCYNNAQVAPQYRQAYEAKPVIADQYPSLEAVLDLNPDFIYGRGSAFGDKDTSIATHDQLSRYGIMSLSSIESYQLGCEVQDVYADFYNLGNIFMVQDRAEIVVNGIKAQINGVEQKVKDLEPVKVFNFDSIQQGGAYTPGNNLTSSLIRHAGGINIFGHMEKTWNTVSWEAVVEANPDMIVINDYGDTSAQDKIDLLNANPALAGVKAIKEQNFLVITLPEVFAGARIGDTVEKLAAAFHPQAFQ